MFAKEVFPNNDGADVLVSDGEHECCVFCYPCQIKKGEKVICPLIIFETGNIVKSISSKTSIQSQKSLSKYNYWVVAKVADVDSGEIRVGSLRMMLNAQGLPGDIRANEMIEFAAHRIDL